MYCPCGKKCNPSTIYSINKKYYCSSKCFSIQFKHNNIKTLIQAFNSVAINKQ